MAAPFRSGFARYLMAASAALLVHGSALAQDAKAYVVGFLEVRDPAWIEEYRLKTGALVQKHGGRFIANDQAATLLEGDQKTPSALVLIEFPSAEAAKAWYNDPDYAPLIKLRQTGADLDLFVAQGFKD